MIAPCSCGEAHPHVVARRRTADDHPIEVWSDGRITDARSGAYLPGVQPIPVAAIWDLVEVVSLYTRLELGVIVGEARRFARTVAGRALAGDVGRVAVEVARALLARRGRTARRLAEVRAGTRESPPHRGPCAFSSCRVCYPRVW